MNKTRRRRHRRALREARGRDRQKVIFGVDYGVDGTTAVVGVVGPDGRVKIDAMATAFIGPSHIDVLQGTVSSRGGPRPHVVHADEIELMDRDVWTADSSTAPTREEWGEILLTAKRRKRSIKSLAQKAGWILVEGSDPKTRESWYRLKP